MPTCPGAGEGIMQEMEKMKDERRRRRGKEEEEEEKEAKRKEKKKRSLSPSCRGLTEPLPLSVGRPAGSISSRHGVTWHCNALHAIFPRLGFSDLIT
jgi:hypothetical protein